jgi:hypothetical protein
MATTTKTMARVAATTNTATTLYTVPASTTAVVTNIVVANTAAAGTFTLALDSVALFTTVAIAANTTVAIDLKQNLTTGKTITGGASETTINFHISGVEIV